MSVYYIYLPWELWRIQQWNWHQSCPQRILRVGNCLFSYLHAISSKYLPDIFSIKLKQRFYFSTWLVSCGSLVLSWKNGNNTAQGSGRDWWQSSAIWIFGLGLIWRSWEPQCAHYWAATNIPKTLNAGTRTENNVLCSDSCFFRCPGPMFIETSFTLQISLKGNGVVVFILCSAVPKHSEEGTPWRGGITRPSVSTRAALLLTVECIGILCMILLLERFKFFKRIKWSKELLFQNITRSPGEWTNPSP